MERNVVEQLFVEMFYDLFEYTIYAGSLLSVAIIYTKSVLHFTQLISKFCFYYYRNNYYCQFAWKITEKKGKIMILLPIMQYGSLCCLTFYALPLEEFKEKNLNYRENLLLLHTISSISFTKISWL